MSYLATICLFFPLSIYLWLLSGFLLQNLFLLVKKVGLVFGSVLSVLYREKLCLSALFGQYGIISALFLFLIFLFYWYVFVNRSFFRWGGNTPGHIFFVFLYGSFQNIVYVVFKISIRILWSGGVEKVGFLNLGECGSMYSSLPLGHIGSWMLM